MDIIVLQGLSNTGKTTTIGKVYDLILNNGGISLGKESLGADPKDFLDVVNYKNMRIVFFSMGDNSNELSEAISNYSSLNCHYFVCSLSESTPKVRANNKINSFKHTRINKTVNNSVLNENKSNNKDANIIYNLI
jgi:hypothetical protein